MHFVHFHSCSYHLLDTPIAYIKIRCGIEFFKHHNIEIDLVLIELTCYLQIELHIFHCRVSFLSKYQRMLRKDEH